jgi:hypothetical protein
MSSDPPKARRFRLLFCRGFAGAPVIIGDRGRQTKIKIENNQLSGDGSGLAVLIEVTANKPNARGASHPPSHLVKGFFLPLLAEGGFRARLDRTCRVTIASQPFPQNAPFVRRKRRRAIRAGELLRHRGVSALIEAMAFFGLRRLFGLVATEHSRKLDRGTLTVGQAARRIEIEITTVKRAHWLALRVRWL